MEKGFGVLKVPRGIGIEVVEEMIEQMCLECKLIDDTNKTPYPRQTHLQMFVEPRNKIQEDGLAFLNIWGGVMTHKINICGLLYENQIKKEKNN